jgi:site-specific recombinase XerD
LEKQYLPLKLCRSADVMGYLQTLRERGNQSRTIGQKLRAIYLLFECEQIKPNPAAVLKIKGGQRSIPTALFSAEELDQLYQSYPDYNEQLKRDKVGIGLMIYQAVSKGELMQLEVSDVNLVAQYIHIPSSKRSNPRRIGIDPIQIPILEEYITTIRPGLMTKHTESLLVNTKAHNVRGIIDGIVKRLKATYPGQVQSISQLRSSRIACWLKKHPLRKVQYLAGHRYVSSTERYQMQHLEDLQKALIKYHPK